MGPGETFLFGPCCTFLFGKDRILEEPSSWVWSVWGRMVGCFQWRRRVRKRIGGGGGEMIVQRM